MTKELLQQALDALDKSIIFANSQGIGGWQPTVMACHEAKDAIKQALAQQEQEAQQQCWCDQQGIGEPGVSCGDCPTRDYKQQEQPVLSDEQIAEIAKPFISSMGDHWCHEDGIRDNGTIEEFARAVIEAHCRGGVK